LLPRLAAGLACALLLAGAAPRPSLVGIWLGHGQPGDRGVVYLNEIRANGTFRSQFRKYDETCRIVVDVLETGTWKLAGDIEQMITTIADGKPVRFAETYKIERLTEREQHARQHDNGHLFIETRVAKFEFPPCRKG
jgi:hypothetical protein